jgi:hypothetical protein
MIESPLNCKRISSIHPLDIHFGASARVETTGQHSLPETLAYQNNVRIVSVADVSIRLGVNLWADFCILLKREEDGGRELAQMVTKIY